MTGGGGIDLLQVGGSQADDNFLLEVDRVINGAITVVHDAVEQLVVNAGGGDDTLVIHDSLSTAVARSCAKIPVRVVERSSRRLATSTTESKRVLPLL